MRLFATILAAAAIACGTVRAEETLLSNGEVVQGAAEAGPSGWQIGKAKQRHGDVICVHFTNDPPQRVASGIFLRGGTLLVGTLQTLKGDEVLFSSTTFGVLTLKREDLAGILFAPPLGARESTGDLTRYSSLLAGSFGTLDAELQPGKICRLRLNNLDTFTAGEIKRIGADMITYKDKSGTIPPGLERTNVRVIEMVVAPPATATDDEYFVRLRSGDLLRGKILSLSNRGLSLKTGFMEDKTLSPSMLASIFPVGLPLASLGKNFGVAWLSGEKPEKAQHTPLFDSNFPPRMDAAVEGGELNFGEVFCERGIGVHSRTVLSFAIPPSATRFVALRGIDAGSNHRGAVAARVLADGKELWSEANVTAKEGAKGISVPLNNNKLLELVVDYGPDEDDSGDHFDWGWAAVLK